MVDDPLYVDCRRYDQLAHGCDYTATVTVELGPDWFFVECKVVEHGGPSTFAQCVRASTYARKSGGAALAVAKEFMADPLRYEARKIVR